MIFQIVIDFYLIVQEKNTYIFHIRSRFLHVFDMYSYIYMCILVLASGQAISKNLVDDVLVNGRFENSMYTDCKNFAWKLT